MSNRMKQHAKTKQSSGAIQSHKAMAMGQNGVAAQKKIIISGGAKANFVKK